MIIAVGMMLFLGLFCGQSWRVYAYTLDMHMHTFTSYALLKMYVSVYVLKTMGLYPYLQFQFNTTGLCVCVFLTFYILNSIF